MFNSAHFWQFLQIWIRGRGPLDQLYWNFWMYVRRIRARLCQPPMLSAGEVDHLRRRQGDEVVGLVVFSGLAQMLGRAKSGDGNETSDVEGMPEIAHPKPMSGIIGTSMSSQRTTRRDLEWGLIRCRYLGKYLRVLYHKSEFGCRGAYDNAKIYNR